MNKLKNKYFFGLLILLLALSQQVSAQASIDSNYIFSGFTERLAFFNKMPIAKKSIIFIGDSLTEAGRWKDIAPEYSILNRGISGDISFGVKARLEEIIRHQPSKIFLMVGVNDLKREVPKQYIIRNYELIVSEIIKKSPKTKIYLNSILPINSSKLIDAFKAVKNTDIERLNVELEKISAKYKSVKFINLHNVLADSQGELRADITPDGIHLEVSAYVELVDYLKQLKAL